MRKDVLEFERNFMMQVITLYTELVTNTYKHSPYYAFNIADPKPRHIHKAKVRDRLLHHALYRILYPFLIVLLLLIHILVDQEREHIKQLIALKILKQSFKE